MEGVGLDGPSTFYFNKISFLELIFFSWEGVLPSSKIVTNLIYRKGSLVIEILLYTNTPPVTFMAVSVNLVHLTYVNTIKN